MKIIEETRSVRRPSPGTTLIELLAVIVPLASPAALNARACAGGEGRIAAAELTRPVWHPHS
ncbi:MAG: hypothetical protein ABSH48_19605 [Verrucomicrobiota bacterium]